MEEGQENISLEQTKPENSLKKLFNSVTPFSKYLAMALFVALPFIGFWVGLNYKENQLPPDFSQDNLLSNKIDNRIPFYQLQKNTTNRTNIIGYDIHKKYIYQNNSLKIKAGSFVEIKKMILIK